MAELCKQCSVELYGTPTSELQGLVTAEQYAAGLVAKAECDDCGTIYVDHEGTCQSKCCEKQHGEY